jgi:carbon-monoxide dehydrogenase medium subunit
VRFPEWNDERLGVGFQEVSARRSDFAFASAAAQLALDEDGACRRLAIAIGAVTDFPRRLHRAEQALVGTRLGPAAVRSAVEEALGEIDTVHDVHASAAYRRRAAVALAARAVAEALAQARAHA